MRRNTFHNYGFVKPKSRFNLLLLEPSEQYLNDCACIISVNRNGNDTIHIKSSLYEDMKEDNVIKPFTLNEEELTHEFIPKYVNFEEIFQLLTRVYKLVKNGDKDDIFDYSNEYISSRLSSIQPHMGMFKRVDEKILENCTATQILPLMEIAGRFIITQYAFYFMPYVDDSLVVKNAALSECVHLFRRRYLMQHNGLEFFFNKTSTFLVFENTQQRNRLHHIILTQTKCKLHADDGTQFNEMIKKWQNRSISNFEYLIYLNFLSGRSYNDLTQYPVFPWIINNYSTSTLDLKDPNNYRDLSKPIGSLSSERLNKLKERMNEMQPPLFLYGTHYSAPAYVVFYLVRLVPEFMLHLQSGVFDKPDRIFSSIEECWNGVMSHTSDVKELVPEFYESTNFLQNNDHVYFGYRSSQDIIDNVKLPAWADTPQQFTNIMKEALESEYVSKNINKWVDLIFGYLQRPPAAFDADNVFYHATYENDFTDSKTIGFREQIREFGQTPAQLFEIPSPERDSTLQINYPVPPIQAIDPATSFDSPPLSMIDFKCLTTKNRQVIEVKGLDKPLILESVDIDLDDGKEEEPVKQPPQRSGSGFFGFSFFNKKK